MLPEMKRGAADVCLTTMACLFVMAAGADVGCRRSDLKPSAQAMAEKAPAAAVPQIPSAFGPLRIRPSEKEGRTGCHVTHADDRSVAFDIPADILWSIIGDSRMSEATRVKAVLAYPGMAAAMRQTAVAAQAVTDERPPTVLGSGAQGKVEIRQDPGDRAYVVIRSGDKEYRMPAGTAYRVLDDALLSETQKVHALLSFPLLAPVAPQR